MGVLSSGLILGGPVGVRELMALGLIVPAIGLVLLGPSILARLGLNGKR